jgi:hypothetical protein
MDILSRHFFLPRIMSGSTSERVWYLELISAWLPAAEIDDEPASESRESDAWGALSTSSESAWGTTAPRDSKPEDM